MHIAMWSGPRNLSTALMYSFAARDDCAIWDEPYYAAYLAKTGLDHPMRNDILNSWEQDPEKVAARCIGAIPDNKSVFYQKHMTQHMLKEFDRGWINQMVNVFLIRHPARVLASYNAKRENPSLGDIGFTQQLELFRQLRDETSADPIVIDSYDIRKNPTLALQKLCDAIELDFQPSMLHWPTGGHKDDGPWAPHWYGAVHQSSGFASQEGALPALPDNLLDTYKQALACYDELQAFKL